MFKNILILISPILLALYFVILMVLMHYGGTSAMAAGLLATCFWLLYRVRKKRETARRSC